MPNGNYNARNGLTGGITMEKGNLSIHSENILPIIKKWLYSDQDIFVRELISNGVDAITKLKKLTDMGEATDTSEEDPYAITVRVDKEARVIVFQDNGIGMTADEVKEYITQIAFSGASAFLEKYKDDNAQEIIGHFGLGFYSAFMVADKVQINSLSFREGSEAVHWECDGGIEYSMSQSDKASRGTIITLHISEDGSEFLDEFKLRGIITKYCGYMPVPIYLETPDSLKNADTKEKVEPVEDTSSADEDVDDTAKTPINDTSPLWLKSASECTDEEYRGFYQKAFMDFKPPLFWIHLNMDYPFRLKGILYFPSLKHDPEYMEGQVKLFNNQVYIADNIKEVIPEYLLLLKGVMDCPDLPLNVSRSFLQNDSTVKKMAGYISRKVAEKLNGLFKKDRDDYNGYWDDISPFIKYGCIKERDFYDKLRGSILYKTIDGRYLTLDELTTDDAEDASAADSDVVDSGEAADLANADKTADANKDSDAAKSTGKTVYYVTDAQLQSQYINMFNEQNLMAVELTTRLDNPFISYLETYEPGVKFSRIDSDITGALKDEGGESEENEGLQTYFRDLLNSQKLGLKLEQLKSEDVSSVILLSEQSRRMQEMSKMFGGADMPPGMFEEELTLVLNRNHSLVKMLMDIYGDTSRSQDVELIAHQLYDLAMLSHKPLDKEQMKRFVERCNKVMEMATSKI